MAYQFLSEEWASAVNTALQNDPGFKNSIANADLTLQFHISDTPDGEKEYYLSAHQGTADVALGAADDPDVNVGQNYETAVAIAKGELNTQTAFMTGKIKVTGNLAKLMMYQGAISQMQAAVKDIEVEF